MKSDLPKVLQPLAGRPMVQFVLEAARSLEPTRVAVVVGYQGELMRQVLGEGVLTPIQAEALGTAHAVQQAESVIAGYGDTTLVLYGDTPLICPETLRRMVDHHTATRATLTILSFRPETPTGYGRIIREEGAGCVLRIIEEKELTPEQLLIGEANSGILCFRDRWLWPNLAQLPRHPDGEYYLTDLVAVAVRQGERVEALLAGDPLEVTGVDDRVRLARAEGVMRRRINERWMLAGVTLVDPAATYIDSTVVLENGSVIWPGTFLQGQTRIGQGCIIGPGTIIRNSTIGPRCRVELSVVEGATMEEGSNAGPFSHLRKGAHLGAEVHVGNFGEIKNSVLGPGAKMGHFSYLGDATVGARANIGAGTITCNYDGERKNPTVIGEEAFIGSDTLLVAPVTVGEGAKTGAGAVVTHDVPAGSVAYGVPARVRPPEPDSAPAEEVQDK